MLRGMQSKILKSGQHELQNAEGLSILCKHKNCKIADYMASGVLGVST